MATSQKPTSSPRVRPIKGFTLIELITGLVIVSLLGGLGFAWMSTVTQKNQLQAQADALKNAIRYARAQAYLMGRACALKPLPAANGNWSKGMGLFEGEKVIYTWHWPKSSLDIQWIGFHGQQYVLFASNFRHASASGHFEITDAYQHRATVVINRLGRVRPYKN